MQFNRTLGAAFVAAAAIVTAQCGSGNSSPALSGSLALPSAASSLAGDTAISTRAVGDVVNATPELGKIKVCKLGNVSGTFTVTGGNAEVSILPNPTIPSGLCWVVAESSEAPGVPPASAGASITITENPATFLASVDLQRNDAGTISTGTFANGGTLFLNDFHGFTVTFTNDEPEPPPPGNEGCTPGFWKAPQHLDSWTTYNPGADFDATFGVNFFSPNITLLQAVGLGGGGTQALARHGVAALLNAASGDVDAVYTTAEVIAIVQGSGAYAGLSVEARKNLLVAANELGCPLT